MHSQRLDTWLWCARFYRTRAVAADAIKERKVEVNGCRAKPAKMLRSGDRVVIRRPPYTIEIEILGFVERRAGVAGAAALYRETERSRQERETMRELLEMDAAAGPRPRGKPSKKERRALDRLKRSF